MSVHPPQRTLNCSTTLGRCPVVSLTRIQFEGDHLTCRWIIKQMPVELRRLATKRRPSDVFGETARGQRHARPRRIARSELGRELQKRLAEAIASNKSNHESISQDELSTSNETPQDPYDVMSKPSEEFDQVCKERDQVTCDDRKTVIRSRLSNYTELQFSTEPLSTIAEKSMKTTNPLLPIPCVKVDSVVSSVTAERDFSSGKYDPNVNIFEQLSSESRCLHLDGSELNAPVKTVVDTEQPPDKLPLSLTTIRSCESLKNLYCQPTVADREETSSRIRDQRLVQQRIEYIPIVNSEEKWSTAHGTIFDKATAYDVSIDDCTNIGVGAQCQTADQIALADNSILLPQVELSKPFDRSGQAIKESACRKLGKHWNAYRRHFYVYRSAWHRFVKCLTGLRSRRKLSKPTKLKHRKPRKAEVCSTDKLNAKSKIRQSNTSPIANGLLLTSDESSVEALLRLTTQLNDAFAKHKAKTASAPCQSSGVQCKKKSPKRVRLHEINMLSTADDVLAQQLGPRFNWLENKILSSTKVTNTVSNTASLQSSKAFINRSPQRDSVVKKIASDISSESNQSHEQSHAAAVQAAEAILSLSNHLKADSNMTVDETTNVASVSIKSAKSANITLSTDTISLNNDGGACTAQPGTARMFALNMVSDVCNTLARSEKESSTQACTSPLQQLELQQVLHDNRRAQASSAVIGNENFRVSENDIFKSQSSTNLFTSQANILHGGNGTVNCRNFVSASDLSIRHEHQCFSTHQSRNGDRCRSSLEAERDKLCYDIHCNSNKSDKLKAPASTETKMIINKHPAHSRQSSVKILVRSARPPLAHVTKLDLTMYTFLYCSYDYMKNSLKHTSVKSEKGKLEGYTKVPLKQNHLLLSDVNCDQAEIFPVRSFHPFGMAVEQRKTTEQKLWNWRPPVPNPSDMTDAHLIQRTDEFSQNSVRSTTPCALSDGHENLARMMTAPFAARESTVSSQPSIPACDNRVAFMKNQPNSVTVHPVGHQASQQFSVPVSVYQVASTLSLNIRQRNPSNNLSIRGNVARDTKTPVEALDMEQIYRQRSATSSQNDCLSFMSNQAGPLENLYALVDNHAVVQPLVSLPSVQPHGLTESSDCSAGRLSEKNQVLVVADHHKLVNNSYFEMISQGQQHTHRSPDVQRTSYSNNSENWLSERLTAYDVDATYGRNARFTQNNDTRLTSQPFGQHMSSSMAHYIERNYKCATCSKSASFVCSACKLVPYCSPRCQATSWRQGHSVECHSAV